MATEADVPAGEYERVRVSEDAHENAAHGDLPSADTSDLRVMRRRHAVVDRRRDVPHYEDQARLAQLEAALADCVRYIANTYSSIKCDPPIAVYVAPRSEPACSIEAKRLLGWTLG